MRLLRFAALLSALLSGCQKAERYLPRSDETTNKRGHAQTANAAGSAAPFDSEIQWLDIFHPPKPDLLIEFVPADKAEWAKLPKFWNAPALTKPDQAAAILGLSPLTASALAGSGGSVVKIKVPLGLPDPGKFVPAGNPMTLGKWKLGQRLFFDDSWLEAKPGTSCASCHRPDHGFADEKRLHGGFNAPTLLNCVFNHRQFWDGRVELFEEVVQRGLDDERISDPPQPFRHTWSGVIHRLRNQPAYWEPFNEVFGKPPDDTDGKERPNITQDSVGRALATYLRTLLSGDSIHDRALREQAKKHSPALRQEHYEAVLDAAALKELRRDKAKSDVAAELMRGYLLFHGRDESRPLMNCLRCHSGPNFTDNAFHNLGVGIAEPDQQGGRFAQAPIGRKSRYLIDAYKTPMLRGLLRTGPYFHNGEANRLREVVEFYNQGARRNGHLDPELRGKNDKTRLLGLSESEIDAVVLFLRALNGTDVDSILKK